MRHHILRFAGVVCVGVLISAGAATAQAASSGGIVYGKVKVRENGNEVVLKALNGFSIYGGMPGSWIEAVYFPETGSYIATLSRAGKWSFGVDLHPESGFVFPERQFDVSVSKGGVVERDIFLESAGAALSGQVTRADGTAIENALVRVADVFRKGQRPAEISALTDDRGRYLAFVPNGKYLLRVFSKAAGGVINPATRAVEAKTGERVSETLASRKSDGRISGNVTFGGRGVPSALIWGWSESGGYAETASGQNGEYTLAFRNHDTWHVYAAWKSGAQAYESREVVIRFLGNEVSGQALELLPLPYALPPARAVQGDAAGAIAVVLDDGMKLYLPPRAAGDRGLITVRIEPAVGEVPLSIPGVRAVGIPYAVRVFNESGAEVTALKYPARLEIPRAQNGSAYLSALAFWDETIDTWSTDGIRSVVHTDGEKSFVIGAVDHLTTYVITNPELTVTSLSPSSGAQGSTIQNAFVRGTGFSAGLSAVTIGGGGVSVSLTQLDSPSDTEAPIQIVVASSASPGTRDVTVQTTDQRQVTGPGLFTVTGSGVTVPGGGPPPPSFRFSLSLDRASLSLPAGGQAAVVTNLAALSGNPRSVTLSASGMPSGVSFSFAPASCVVPCSSTLTLSGQATPGNYSVIVRGISVPPDTGSPVVEDFAELSLAVPAPPAPPPPPPPPPSSPGGSSPPSPPPAPPAGSFVVSAQVQSVEGTAARIFFSATRLVTARLSCRDGAALMTREAVTPNIIGLMVVAFAEGPAREVSCTLRAQDLAGSEAESRIAFNVGSGVVTPAPAGTSPGGTPGSPTPIPAPSPAPVSRPRGSGTPSSSLTQARIEELLSMVPTDMVIRQGDRGEAVARLKVVLGALGYYEGTPTEIADENTFAAVRAFQRDELGFTGPVYGPLTEEALKRRLAAAASPKKETASVVLSDGEKAVLKEMSLFSRERILRPGSAGDEVGFLQQALRVLGHYPADLNPTKYYGPITGVSVRKFQVARIKDILEQLGVPNGTTVFGSASIEEMNRLIEAAKKN